MKLNGRLITSVLTLRGWWNSSSLLANNFSVFFSEKLDRVNQLNIQISQLCREFNENIIIDPGTVDIFPASRLPQTLHHLPQAHLSFQTCNFKGITGEQRCHERKGFLYTNRSTYLSSVLQWASDDEVRKLAYIKGNSVPQANLGVLDKLIATRHELAQVMGYRSYAEFNVKPNMSSSPEVVMSFLREMSKMVRPSTDEELNKIKEFKREKCGQKDVDLEPWDEAYYTAMMKSSAYDLDSSVVASYFPLPQCESWHPDVLKMSLHHPEEGDLGGRRVSDTEYQLPVVALVCNFSSSRNSSTARLNHSELETLFHEFGHALHSLLSRTDYQHFSGTRVVLDLAETPSNLFEYYSWDYRVLKTFAKHYSTGEIIPEKLVASMQGARKMFAATDLQRQIFYAAMDQTFFGEQPIPPTSSVVEDLKREYTSWKHVEGTNWQARFNHLLNYGAGYYSYLYAKCFAATIWQKLCQEDPLSLTTGTALRTKFLQHGGAKEPDDLLNGLVGDGILRECNGGLIPDINCLSNEMKLVEKS
ncbi:hypothetical protein M0R45_037885 [Rubus argutus]|uniref:Peptidase M3A/M3B catalytic domain-containing protein n=1 Tax=Rubus argutus TaxID=59490 RepID=A0AAW1W451_RUBAR